MGRIIFIQEEQRAGGTFNRPLPWDDMLVLSDYHYICLCEDCNVVSVTWGPGGLTIQSQQRVGLGSAPLSNLVLMRPQALLQPQPIRQ